MEINHHSVAELSPQRWRGVTLSLVTFSILPFMPAVLYVVLCQQAGTWRYTCKHDLFASCETSLYANPLRLTVAICGGWNFIGLIGIVLCYRPPKREMAKGLTTAEVFKRIDYVGAFLSIGGVTLFLVGLQAGGYQYKWTDGRVLGPLISGILLLIAFPAWEVWGPHEYPMVPAAIFRGQRTVGLAFAIVFIAGMDFYSILGFFPVALQNVYHTSAITLGIRAISYPCAILGGACIVSAAMSYTKGHVRVLFLVIAAIMTAFTGSLAASTPHNPGYTITMATIAAFGNGGLVVPALTLALYACPDEYIGTTTALSLSSRFVGGSIGTTIYFNVFHTKIAKLFPAMVGGAAIQAGLPKESLVPFVTAMNSPAFDMLAPQVPGANAAIVTAANMERQWAFAESLKYVWYTTIPFGIISVLACFFLPNIEKYMTDRVAVVSEPQAIMLLRGANAKNAEPSLTSTYLGLKAGSSRSELSDTVVYFPVA